MTSRNALMFLTVCMLAGFALAARAEVRIVMPDDAAGADVRAAASDFLTKLADGDAKGAKELFAGEADQAKVLDAYFEWMASFDALSNRFTEKFGEAQAASPIQVALRGLVDHQKEKAIVLNGDVATFASEGKLYDWGMELHRADGKWNVTHLTANHELAAGVLEQLQRLIAAAKKIDRDVETGRTTSMKDAGEAFRAELSKAMQPALKYTARPIASPAVKWNGIDPQEVAGYWGKDLRTPEMTKLISSLPGTPYISSSREFAELVAQDAGILMFFQPRQGLVRLMLNAGGSEGYLQYPGKLPGGLAFSDLRKDVEKILGGPVSSGGGYSGSAYFADYPQLGMTIYYAKDKPRDPENPIASILLMPPIRNAQAAAGKPAKGPRITFRLVVSDPAVPADELPYSAGAAQNATLRVSREVLLDEKGISGIYGIKERPDSPQLVTGMEMTDEGAKKLEEVTSQNIGRQLAILLDGRIVIAPNIRSAIGKRLIIGMGAGAKEKDSAEIRGRLHAAVNALPEH